jgi:hypothetical protein
MSQDNYPDLDWQKLYEACLYALAQLYVAALKDGDTVFLSADEHRSMAYRRLRDAMKEKK